MHGDEQIDGLRTDGDYLIVENQVETADALLAASNAEGDGAEYVYSGQDAIFARRAARSLDALCGRVLAMRPMAICAWCKRTVREGPVPVTHTICDACESEVDPGG